jgi:hypothetical protein
MRGIVVSGQRGRISDKNKNKGRRYACEQSARQPHLVSFPRLRAENFIAGSLASSESRVEVVQFLQTVSANRVCKSHLANRAGKGQLAAI